MADRLLRVYGDAPPGLREEGLTWYERAHEIAYGLERRTAVGSGVLAALSPMTSWPRNVELATILIDRGDCPHTMRCRLTARAIRLGAPPLCVLNGPKVRAFYSCIETGGDCDGVCIDRHAYRAAVGQRPRRAAPSIREYEGIANEYREAAARAGVTPPRLQAVVWCVQRTAGDPRQRLLPF